MLACALRIFPLDTYVDVSVVADHASGSGCRYAALS